MKASEIKVGEAYQAKVAGRTHEVRIERKLPRGGWEAVGLTTNKKICIKTPQQLVGPATPSEAKPQSEEPVVAPAEDEQAGLNPGNGEASDPTEPAASAAEGKRARGSATAKPAPSSNVEPADQKKLSCLDAAAQVLKDKGEPLNCKQMIDAMFAAKLWHSDAPTPSATLSSAILREMTTRKEASRFRKTGRGLFTFSGK